MSFYGERNFVANFDAFYTLGSTSVFYLTKIFVRATNQSFSLFIIISDIVVKRPDL